MSGVGKALKKVVKGVGKVAKGIVKGIAKVGKKLVKGIGKVMGKLGPIGTMAIAFIAPYALPALAGAGIPVLSSVAKGVMAVNSAIAAPFKALGKFVGAGVSKGGAALAKTIGVDTAVGKGISSITTKLASSLGYEAGGGTVMEQMKGVFDNVSAKFGDVFAEPGYVAPSAESASFDAGLEHGKPAEFGKLGYEGAGTGQTVDNPFNMELQTGQYNVKPVDTTLAGTGAEGMMNPTQVTNQQAMGEVFNERFASDVYDSEKNTWAYDVTAENPEAGFLGTQPPKEAPSLWDRATKAGGKALSSLFSGAPEMPQLPEWNPVEDPGGGAVKGSAGPGGDGYGGQGRSFYAQDQTGLMTTEDFVNRSFSLLGRTARGLA